MTKYAPLGRYLPLRRVGPIDLTFAEIEEILGFSLPNSAHAYPAWWANERDGMHSHARSWLNAGYETYEVDLAQKRVKFRKR